MIASLNIVDNFYTDYEAVRQFALSHDFTVVPEHDGHKYPGFSPVKDPRFLSYTEELLKDAIGAPAQIQMAHFAAGTEDHRTVQWIHADNGVSDFAGVVYLNDQPGYGTAFWRHIVTKAEGLKQCLRTEPFLTRNPLPWETLQRQGQSQDAWDRTDYAESKANRLVVYPTDRFHSRWPEHGFGNKPENCRLTLAFFFNLV